MTTVGNTCTTLEHEYAEAMKATKQLRKHVAEYEEVVREYSLKCNLETRFKDLKVTHEASVKKTKDQAAAH